MAVLNQSNASVLFMFTNFASKTSRFILYGKIKYGSSRLSRIHCSTVPDSGLSAYRDVAKSNILWCAHLSRVRCACQHLRGLHMRACHARGKCVRNGSSNRPPVFTFLKIVDIKDNEFSAPKSSRLNYPVGTPTGLYASPGSNIG
jgi:hypothetical protein